MTILAKGDQVGHAVVVPVEIDVVNIQRSPHQVCINSTNLTPIAVSRVDFAFYLPKFSRIQIAIAPVPKVGVASTGHFLRVCSIRTFPATKLLQRPLSGNERGVALRAIANNPWHELAAHFWDLVQALSTAS